MGNTPWTRLVLDNFIVEHHKMKTKITLGSISETAMDSFILSKVPNPNVCGKSMAKFVETIAPEKEKEEVVTLNYREDEETYLPFYGVQVKGKAKILANMDWELMGSKLPFGANPTAGPGQSLPNNVTYPLAMSFNGRWHLGDRGTIRFDYLRAIEEKNIARIPNHGNYFFWDRSPELRKYFRLPAAHEGECLCLPAGAEFIRDQPQLPLRAEQYPHRPCLWYNRIPSQHRITLYSEREPFQGRRGVDQ